MSKSFVSVRGSPTRRRGPIADQTRANADGTEAGHAGEVERHPRRAGGRSATPRHATQVGAEAGHRSMRRATADSNLDHLLSLARKAADRELFGRGDELDE